MVPNQGSGAVQVTPFLTLINVLYIPKFLTYYPSVNLPNIITAN